MGAAASGDRVAALYREHALGLVRVALLLVGDRGTAEDVVQDAFCALYRGWWRLRDPDKAVAYVRVAVLNGCRSVLRDRARARKLPAPAELPVWSAEAAAIAGEERRAALEAVASLPPRAREVLVLRY
jgi:RNA polymerase sigma factor (sigma-70 family)